LNNTNQESIVIDPVAMKIINRIAAGSRSEGVLECQGGVMVEGSFVGTLVVKGGPLVLMPVGVIRGVMTCDGDAYLFGTIEEQTNGEPSELEAHGAVFLTETVNAKANITAGAFKTYEGSQVDGRIKTIKRG
jgi:cytoskeletal protein CcmA (bactofilin family)